MGRRFQRASEITEPESGIRGQGSGTKNLKPEIKNRKLLPHLDNLKSHNTIYCGFFIDTPASVLYKSTLRCDEQRKERNTFEEIGTFEKCLFLFKFKSKIPDFERGKAKILTTDIHWVFRGLKFEPDKDIGQKGTLCEGLTDRLEGICGECLMKHICLGSCIAQNYYTRKNLWAPFWYCEEAENAGLFPKTRKSPIFGQRMSFEEKKQHEVANTETD